MKGKTIKTIGRIMNGLLGIVFVAMISATWYIPLLLSQRIIFTIAGLLLLAGIVWQYIPIRYTHLKLRGVIVSIIVAIVAILCITNIIIGVLVV